MSFSSFIANSLPEALAQMRACFGPDGVVLNVRYRQPSGRFARLWQQPQVEVLAGPRPQPTAPVPVSQPQAVQSPVIQNLLSTISERHQQLGSSLLCPSIPQEIPIDSAPAITPHTFKSLLVESIAPKSDSDRSAALERTISKPSSHQLSPSPFESVAATLHQLGLRGDAINRVASKIYGESFAFSDGERQNALIRSVLASFWKMPPRLPSSPSSHLFVGAAGCGKTTVLSKWLAQVVLLGGSSAYVWRLDGRSANTGEALSIYSEVLGVPVARAWSGESQPVDFEFFDLPGTDWWDAAAVAELAERIRQIKPTQVHLVLNAAYDTALLLAQLQTFSQVPLTDIIFSHFDEPFQLGKLWNIALATALPIRFLSAGQNVPGNFREATPDQLFPEEFR